MNKIIFFGNGPLADYALSVLEQNFEVIFHAREKADLVKVKELKAAHPETHGILASFGVMIKSDILDLFEPEGILNIHPSLLPAYRGPSPIEGAILNGDTEFSVSIMKLVLAMDAGPIYYQETLRDLPLEKEEIYKALAECGAKWLSLNLSNLPEPVAQDDKAATFTQKFEKSDGIFDFSKTLTEVAYRKIVAFQGFPKVKYTFFGLPCIILEAEILKPGETAVLEIPCLDGALSVKKLQPEGRKAMDAKSFLNGHKKN